MIEIIGNLFEFEGEAICLTTNGDVKKDGSNPMGRGVALQAAKRWPGLARRVGDKIKRFGNHTQLLTVTDPQLGLTIPTPSGHEEIPFDVFMLPVKSSWRERANLDLIRRSLEELVEITRSNSWCIGLPRPGCGAGGLLWRDVRPICASILKDDRFIIVERNP